MPKKAAPLHAKSAYEVRVDARGAVRLSDAAKLLAVTPQTLRNWIDSGCPYVDKGGRGAGAMTTVRVSDVVAWQIDRSMQDVGAVSDGQYNESRAKAMDMHYRAIIRQAQALEKLKLSVPVDVIAPIVDEEYAAVRNTLMGIPSSLDVRVAAESDPQKCYRMIEEAIHGALLYLSSGRQIAERSGLDPDGSIENLEAIEAMEEAAEAIGDEEEDEEADA